MLEMIGVVYDPHISRSLTQPGYFAQTARIQLNEDYLRMDRQLKSKLVHPPERQHPRLEHGRILVCDVKCQVATAY